jgi:hypothetical protein
LEIVARERPHAQTVALTIHGPGYGLDEKEAFLSLMSGFHEAEISRRSALRSILIFERSPARAKRLELLMPDSHNKEAQISRVVALKDYGTRSEHKPRLFIAMPFADKYFDEYDIAFTEAAHQNGFVCERLDLESFVGDVFSEIKKRILNSSAVVALLNDHNPNVFLEVGFAIAHHKPVILVVDKETLVPFDVRGQKFLKYSRIFELRETLSLEIKNLKLGGALDARSRAQ